MTTETPTEDQEPKTAAEQGESADATGSEDQSSSQNSDDTASGKPGENDGDGTDGDDELTQLRDQVKAKDETITRMQDETGRTALAAQIASLNEADDRAAETDSKAIEDGTLTAANATKAKNDRREATQSKIETYQDKVKDYRAAREDAIDNALLDRERVAYRVAKEFGIDLDVINDDKSLKSPKEMEIKARELQLDEREKSRKGTDVIDSGQRGAASLNVDKMSAMDKIRAGV